MKAALCEDHGPPEVIRIGEIPTPEPGPYEVRVRVRAAAVSSADARARSPAGPPGLARALRGRRGPRRTVFGSEFTGVVEAIGDVVTSFVPGDPVLGFTGSAMGCHAEYVLVPQDGLILPLPPEVPRAEAGAFCFGGVTALEYLRDRALIERGERLLVVGASGSVGSAALQIGRALRAEVTGLSGAANLDLVESLGAEPMDYRAVDPGAQGRRWEVVMDCSGTLDATTGDRLLAKGGRLILPAGGSRAVLRSALRRPRRRLLAGRVRPNLGSLLELARLNLEGAYRPVVSRELPFERIAEAHDLAGSGHKRGNVVVTIP